VDTDYMTDTGRETRLEERVISLLPEGEQEGYRAQCAVRRAEPRWDILQRSLLSQAKVRVNRADLDIALVAAPGPETEVAGQARVLAADLGVSRGRALAYCDIGTMLVTMPTVHEALACGAFSFDHLRVLADATCAVDDAHREAVEEDLVVLLTPTVPNQVVPGVYTLRRQVTELVGRHQPSARPPDPDETTAPPREPAHQLEFSVDTRSPERTVFHIDLPVDEATGVLRVVDAVAEARGSSRAAALTELVLGTAGDVSVTLNCYRNLDTGEMHLENTWLSQVATDRWMARVTELCVPGHSDVGGYTPSEGQRATLAGRDGTCRFPGCDRPAATAQQDHVERWDEDLQEAGRGGKTATWAMQSLCPGCHAMKTRGLWNATLNPDGTCWWTSIDDGHTVVTVPTGPLADAVLTFDRRLQRRVATRAEHNAARLERLAEIKAAAAVARAEADARDREECPF
jgi:hypothetical protein